MHLKICHFSIFNNFTLLVQEHDKHLHTRTFTLLRGTLKFQQGKLKPLIKNT